MMRAFDRTDSLTQAFEQAIAHPRMPQEADELLVGLDIGTAYIVLAVLDGSGEPLAGACRFAQVVRDGIVVDYLGAIEIVKELKNEVELSLGRELDRTATAIPPGTSINDMRFISNVAEAAGLRVAMVVDEPEAANAVLELRNGVVVDVGGGTTGLVVIEDGRIVYTADEPTGGTHCTLVVAGHYGLSFEKAEEFKKRPENRVEVSRLLKPVTQKIASIVARHIVGYQVEEIVMVGGTSCLEGIEDVMEEELGIPTFKPADPLFITPLGIALNCRERPSGNEGHSYGRGMSQGESRWENRSCSEGYSRKEGRLNSREHSRREGRADSAVRFCGDGRSHEEERLCGGLGQSASVPLGNSAPLGIFEPLSERAT